MKSNLLIKTLTALCVMSFCFFSGADGALQEHKEELVEMFETGESHWVTCIRDWVARDYECMEINLNQVSYIVYGSSRIKIVTDSSQLECVREAFHPGRRCLDFEKE